ncbi:hypothetical protein E3N88_37436 [Mikania micrantha]|uniref:Uncharacterized protein n=1 Tax=Mikania micrantha TaxID=192012 RepID=A0A5N6LR75_9ASTR|nr:hypothetical protein E3N88_37436 [Mikania micrantha]
MCVYIRLHHRSGNHHHRAVTATTTIEHLRQPPPPTASGNHCQRSGCFSPSLRPATSTKPHLTIGPTKLTIWLAGDLRSPETVAGNERIRWWQFGVPGENDGLGEEYSRRKSRPITLATRLVF